MGEVGVQDLAAWLLRQINADEEKARAIPETARRWTFEPAQPSHGDDCSYVEAALETRAGYFVAAGDQDDPMTPQQANHMANWDPERVLVECDTKRRIIEQIAPKIDDMDEQIAGEWGGGVDEVADDLLRLLALPYRERDGYLDSWAPDGR